MHVRTRYFRTLVLMVGPRRAAPEGSEPASQFTVTSGGNMVRINLLLALLLAVAPAQAFAQMESAWNRNLFPASAGEESGLKRGGPRYLESNNRGVERQRETPGPGKDRRLRRGFKGLSPCSGEPVLYSS